MRPVSDLVLQWVASPVHMRKVTFLVDGVSWEFCYTHYQSILTIAPEEWIEVVWD